MSNSIRKETDLDIGSGVYIRWTSFEGERIGGILMHPEPKNENGECWGSFWFKQNEKLFAKDSRPLWDFNGDYENPTLSPSFQCHCGFHGWVKDGKWIQA